MSLKDYLAEIGISDPIVTKIENLKSLADKICPEQIDDFLVTEYTKSDKQRVYESVCFFSKGYVMESEQIMSGRSNLDLACIFMNIDSFKIFYSDYDPLTPQKTSEESALEIQCKLGDLLLILKGSGNNCSKLWSIFEKYIKPNIVEIIEVPPDQ